MQNYVLKNEDEYDGSKPKLARLIQHIIYIVQEMFTDYNQIETILRNSLTKEK